MSLMSQSSPVKRFEPREAVHAGSEAAAGVAGGSLEDDEYGDDDVFMDSSSPASFAISSSCSDARPPPALEDSEGKVGPHSSSGRHSDDDSMRSEASSPLPRRKGRLLRRRLFPRGTQVTLDAGRRPDPSSATVASSDLASVAKEKLVTLSHEKLRSYSTDLHSNSDGLRNRVLVESTLKKFFLTELDSPPRPSLPSTPRKRSVSQSPFPPSCPSSPCSPAFAYDDDTTSSLSDSIKRMRIMHSSPSSRASGDDSLLQVSSIEDVELEDCSMGDLAAVLRKIRSLTDLPIDTEL